MGMIKLASFKSKELLWIIKSISSKPTQTIINMDGLIGVLLITIKLKANLLPQWPSAKVCIPIPRWPEAKIALATSGHDSIHPRHGIVPTDTWPGANL